MNQEYQETIQETVATLIEKIGFSATSVSVSLREGAPESFLCDVSVPLGQNFLIGQYGMNLAALQHLVRIVVRKKLKEPLDIVVDVNGYFAEKKQFLEKEAKQALLEVVQNNTVVTLRPMLPYERKIVHDLLSTHEGVTTESTGVGEERRVVVRPSVSKME